MIGSLLLTSAVGGKVPERRGNRADRYAPQGVYPCAGADDWCALCVESDGQWKALAQVIGRERWLSEPRFASVKDGASTENDQ